MTHQDALLPPVTANLSFARPGRAHLEAFTRFMASDRADALGWKADAKAAIDEFSAFVGHHVRRGFGPFVAEHRDTHAPLGLFGPWHPEHQPEPEIIWSIWDADREGCGLAHEAAVSCRSFAYWVLGWRTAVSYIAPGNTRSIRLAKRLGALRDGDWRKPSGKTVEIWRHPDPESV